MLSNVSEVKVLKRRYPFRSFLLRFSILYPILLTMPSYIFITWGFLWPFDFDLQMHLMGIKTIAIIYSINRHTRAKKVNRTNMISSITKYKTIRGVKKKKPMLPFQHANFFFDHSDFFTPSTLSTTWSIFLSLARPVKVLRSRSICNKGE